MEFLKNIYKNFQWLISLLAAILTIINIVILFVGESVLFRILTVIFSIVFLTIMSIVLSVLSTRREDNIKNSFIGDKSILVKENKKYLQNMFNNHELSDVCNFGPAFSRIFYLASAYKSRIVISKLVLEASISQNKYKLCASSLIDIGWTIMLIKENDTYNFVGRVLDSADDYFLLGAEYAKKANDLQLESKAYRHLSGFYIENGNFNEGKVFRDKSEEILMKMEEGIEKRIMLANLIYCDAETAFLTKKYPLAKRLCVKADSLKKNNDEEAREIRYYAQIGKIEYVSGDVEEAMEQFVIGKDKAIRIKRIDEIVKNTYGYAICLIREGQRNEALNQVKIIHKKYGDIPLFVSDEFFIKEYNKLVTRTKFNDGV
jgi:tetratricopeptide (TPR) repeat protein